MTDRGKDKLKRFGFRLGKGGAHSARTIMLREIEALLSYVNYPNATFDDYKKAVCQDNCLGKRSWKSRELTFRHLTELYSLDRFTLFRAFLFFWQRQPESRKLLALLMAFARDGTLRAGASTILSQPQGTTLRRETLEKNLDDLEPGRFSKATLTSVAQNINSSFTQSGHLQGRVKKTRAKPQCFAGAVSMALFLGFLQGARGENLFSTAYCSLLDCSSSQAIEFAEEASRRGWIVCKRAGKIVEVLFPNLLTSEEMEWIRESN